MKKVLIAIGLAQLFLSLSLLTHAADKAAEEGTHLAKAAAYPVELDQIMQQRELRKFTINDIKSFVYRVFSMYERATTKNYHVPPEAFKDIVAPNARFDFPDYKINNWDEFVEWHKWIHDQLVMDDHILNDLQVAYLSDGSYQVKFVVNWRGIFTNGNYVDVNVAQTWLLKEEKGKDLPVIHNYIAEVVKP